MTFVIITHVPHILEQEKYFAYGPYVKEMNIWSKYADKIVIVSPQSYLRKTDIDYHYEHNNIEFLAVEDFNILDLKGLFQSIFKIPLICWQIFKAMRQADHIHLRCPGNMGLLGSFVQILFPHKMKTAKYAGNWDPKSKQPWSYKLQQWILGNTLLTHNMKVLVYGQWEGNTKNIMPFFTATYYEEDKLPLIQHNLNGTIHFVFVGALVSGKNPLYAIQLVEELYNKGYEVALTVYGEGIERDKLEQYIVRNSLGKIITLKGNQTQDTVKKAYQNSHFVILPSESEGWPKAIVEGMFWGCIPVATSVSCVPIMLDNGKRGVLLVMNLENDVNQIETVLQNQLNFDSKRNESAVWSRNYTLDIFDVEIKQLLVSN